MKKHILSALALAAAMVASGAAFAQNIAIVNGLAVPKERADALAQQVARSGRQVTPEMQGQLRDEVIAREIFAQEARKKGLDATEDFKNQMELTLQTILIRELPAGTRPAVPAPGTRLYRVEAAGEDRAGIVAGICGVLAEHATRVGQSSDLDDRRRGARRVSRNSTKTAGTWCGTAGSRAGAG
jgi:hypothetical protein